MSINETISLPITGSITATVADSTPYTVLIDDSTTVGTTYIGKAVIGTAGASALWRVQRVVTTASGTEVRFAGTGAFDQVWNNRTALTYN